MTIGRAVVAGSSFGLRVHVRALRAAGYEVVGLLGRDPEKTVRRAEKAEIPHALTDFEAAATLRPTLLSIATPPHAHYDLARQALEAGVHVVCEKPFTLTLDEAIELAALAEAKGLVGLLGHEFRYVECAALFARLLDEGAIGQPRMATFVAHAGLTANPATPMPEWWFDKARGGGWFGASGSHGVDRIRDWYGEVEAVSAQLTQVGDRSSKDADDSFDILFRTEKGVTGVLQSTCAAWGPAPTLTRALGPRGALWIEDEVLRGNVEAVAGPVLLSDSSGTRVVPVPDDLRLPPPADCSPALARSVAPFAQLYREVAARIEGRAAPNGGPLRPRPATFADGVANMRVMQAVRSSSAAGGAWTAVGGQGAAPTPRG